MIVITNTTPINYLTLIGCIDLLPRLFAQVRAPQAVISELLAPKSPTQVRQFASSPPDWLKIETIARCETITIQRLHAGEEEAIFLYLALNADLFLIDEKWGRSEAMRRGIAFTGTLGVLSAASRKGWIDLEEAVSQLKRTSFHASDSFLDAFLKEELR